MTTEVETFEGVLNYIRFQKPETGFLIGIFLNGKKEIAALGNLLRPEVGMAYKLFGEWIDDSQWGRQFRFRTYEAILPKSTDGIFRYLVTMTKWVGPKIGTKLIELYGSDTLEMLKTSPDRVVAEVKGITTERAKEIQKLLWENQAKEAALVELEDLIGGQGLKRTLPMEILLKWGADAPSRLKEDPYMLIELDGVGFPTADRIATTKFNVNRQSLRRQSACLKHLLRENRQKGNVWLGRAKLLEWAMKTINVDVTLTLERMINQEGLVCDDGLVTLKEMAADESYIAKKIKGLMKDKEPELNREGRMKRKVRMQ